MNDNAPAIVISSLDLQRIEELLELPPHRDSPGTASLRAELARANVLDPAEMPGDVITMNSVATLVDETSGEAREISLVYPRDADTAANKISVLAPVGSAMLGLRVGQSIDWKVPGGRSLRLRCLVPAPGTTQSARRRPVLAHRTRWHGQAGGPGRRRVRRRRSHGGLGTGPLDIPLLQTRDQG